MMTFLFASLLVVPALVAIATSVWLPPGVTLGRPFWTLTIFLVALPLLLMSVWLAMPKDPYGYSVIGLYPVAFFMIIAAGWTLGVGIVLTVRRVRRRTGIMLKP